MSHSCGKAEHWEATGSKLLTNALPGGRRIASSYVIILATFVISLLTALELVVHQEILSMVGSSIIVLIEPMPSLAT